MIVIDKIKTLSKCKYGTVRALSAILGLPQPAIYTWAKVPKKHCIPIETALDGAITRYEMRPDIFGPDPGKTQEEHRT